MTGASEILVLVLLISGILILPRFFKNEPVKKGSTFSPANKIKNLSIKARAAIFLTIAYPVCIALILRPWESNSNWFLITGIAPVVIAWSVKWILGGPKTK